MRRSGRTAARGEGVLRFVGRSARRAGERGRLKEWTRTSEAVTSEITRVECLRALDRLRLAGGMPDRELARRRATALTVLTGFEMVRVNRAVLARAADPFPMRIRTLDALHVASALSGAALRDS